MTTTDYQPPQGLAVYWPSLEEVGAIGTEAENLPDAVLLAVHRPVQMVRRAFAGSDAGQRVQQEALLEHVLHGLKPEGYLLAPVTGPSGAGKSHLVRWLEIRLRQHPLAKQFILVRVPKSASLRSVVESVLDPVADLPVFAGLLKDLTQASSALPPGEAAAMFGTMLQLALTEKVEQWRANGAAIVNGFPAQTLSQHAPALATLLQDPVIAPHFVEKVYPRLLKRVLRGRDETAPDADRPPVFELEDLVLPDALRQNLANASLGARTYYATRLDRGDNRKAAVATLNAVIDGAVQRVFKLGQLSHGKTLQDILCEVRERLYDQKRELVLLVEDFYALTGIQDQLLALCIQGTGDGRRPMCPMRTVMAMTDATLDGRDTIKTRSQYQWSLVTQDTDESQVVDALVDLAGRYLNAARIGQSRLVTAYDPVAGSVCPQFSPEEDDGESSGLRDAFGTSKDGVPLFPLSRNAIRFLARKFLTRGGTIEFNPRLALQHVVRETLLQRPAFERGEFPTGMAIDDALAVELTRVLEAVPRAQRTRCQRAILCWGDDPQTLPDLKRLPGGVLEAFNLPRIPELQGGESGKAGRSATPAPPPKDPVKTAATPPSAPPPPPPPPPTIWQKLMNDWVRGTRLDLIYAQAVRKAIHQRVVAHIDWESLALGPGDFDAQSFRVPNALGQERQHKPHQPVIWVTGPSGREDKPEPELARELLALMRFEEAGCTWDYVEGEDDAPFVAAIVERTARRLAASALEVARLKLVAIAHGAVWSAAIRRNLKGRSPLERMSVVLASDEAAPQPSGQAKWDELRTECFNQRSRLRGELLRRSQVVQGGASTPYGVDGSRLLAALAAQPLDATGIQECLRADAEAGQLATLLGKLTPARLPPVVSAAVDHVRKWTSAAVVDNGLQGAPDEHRELAESAVELMTRAMRSDLWPTPPGGRVNVPPVLDFNSLKSEADAFAALPWPLVVEACTAVKNSTVKDLDESISLLAALPWGHVGVARSFLEAYGRALAGIEGRVAAQERVLGQGGAAPAIGSIRRDLERMHTMLTIMASPAKI